MSQVSNLASRAVRTIRNAGSPRANPIASANNKTNSRIRDRSERRSAFGPLTTGPYTFIRYLSRGDSMPNEGLQELYVKELKDLYNAENQLLKALPKMAKAASSEELRSGF